MVLASAVFAGMSWNIPVSRRVYHVLTTLATIIAALSYFAMASGDGVSYKCEQRTVYHHHLPDTHHTVCRELYWARYVDWTLTTPLLLLDLCLLAGVDGAHTLMAIAASLIMTLTGLFAAFGDRHTAQKWGWFTIAVLAYLFVLWHVVLHGSRMVQAKGEKVKRLFSGLAAFLFVLWTIYPM
jgi:bacteriorhodopsin